MTIMVGSLTLYPDTNVINNDAITQLFVAYKFLNCDPAELETPVALPKPVANRPIHFNFRKGGFPIVCTFDVSVNTVGIFTFT